MHVCYLFAFIPVTLKELINDLETFLFVSKLTLMWAPIRKAHVVKTDTSEDTSTYDFCVLLITISHV